MSRVLVVGGGAAGLAGALLLGRLGHEVTVFEKMPHTAPLIRGFTRRGLHFDTGFHYAGGLESGILASYLDVLGVRKHLACLPLARTGGEIIRFGDRRPDFPITRGRDEFAASVTAEFPGMKDGIERFLAKNEEYVQYSPYLNPTAERFDPRRLLHEDPVTLDAFFGEMQMPTRLRTILGFRCLLYGVHPEQAHLKDLALVNCAYMNDAATVSGGGQALAAAFDRALSESGIEVRTGTKVDGIALGAGNAVRGVRIKRDDNGGIEEVPGELCLYCGAPGALPGLLPAGVLRPVFVNRLLNLKETSKPFIMFGVTRSDFFQHRQLFRCLDESLNGWFPERNAPARFHGKHPFYISGGDGRDGRYPVTALTSVPDDATAKWSGDGVIADRGGYEDLKRKIAETLRRQLLDDCPELAGDLEVVEAATDVTMRHWSFNSSGSLYGKLHGTESSPILPVTRIGGLALAGQNIILPGLLGVTVSAAVAAGFLVGNDQVLELLR